MIYYYTLSFVLTLFLVFVFKKIALRFNIVDQPNHRKMHTNPKPLLGGLAIYLSIFITYSYSINFVYDLKTGTILLMGFVLVLVGLWDDYKDMKALYKLFFQLAVALVTSYIIGGISKIEIYGAIVQFNEWQGILIETIWIVGLINAFNLIDGLDGLSSGMGIISLSSLVLVTLINKDTTSIALIIIVIAALLGFLYYNFYPSTIFLGDSGSMFLGYMVAVLSIDNYKTVTLTSMMLLLLIAFMPFLDVLLAIIRRKKNKQKAFEPDSLHFHHRLMMKGFTHEKAVLILYGIMIFYAVAAIGIELVASVQYKLVIVISLVLLTVFIFERLYLLSDRYAYIHKLLRFIKHDIFRIKRKDKQEKNSNNEKTEQDK